MDFSNTSPLIKKLHISYLKFHPYTMVFLLIGVFLLTRLPMLKTDIINPDGVNWHWRSEQFVVALKAGNWENTYQHYHPGVTLMWLVGPTVEIVKQLNPNATVYNKDTFLLFEYAAKLSVIIAQLGLTLVVFFLLKQLIRAHMAMLITLLFTLEPFFVGNSRLLHMDVLFALLLFIGLLLTFWVVKDLGYESATAKKFVWIKAVLAGTALSLAFLTKSIGIGGIVFALVFGVLWLFAINKPIGVSLKQNVKNYFKPVFLFFVLLIVPFVVTTFAVFPAMWVKPVYTITEIFREGERVGIRNGHGQIILGEYTRDAGPTFYPLVLAMKTSPLLIIGVVLYLFFVTKTLVSKRSETHRFDLIAYLSVFYLGYFLVMTIPSKKIDRYMIPMYPFLALVAVNGFFHLYSKVKTKILFFGSIAGMILAFIVLPLVTFYPYYFTYTGPLFGNSRTANRILAQKPFGVGIPALKDFIFQKYSSVYGDYPQLGFYDIKPMKSIYMNSRICDIRICGVSSYDLLVLGVNEELPEEIIQGKVQFTKDSSFYINGLEYWKIYVKKGQ